MVGVWVKVVLIDDEEKEAGLALLGWRPFFFTVIIEAELTLASHFFRGEATHLGAVWCGWFKGRGYGGGRGREDRRWCWEDSEVM